MSGPTRMRVRPESLDLLRRAAAAGLENLGYAIERDAVADAPVAGDHRSFMTGPKTKAGTPRKGGNLRRSIHTAAYLDGRRISEKAVDGNKRPLPGYVPRDEIAVFVGTNCNYGAYVELGTVKMRARPYLRPAALGNRARGHALIRAGAQRYLRGRTR